MRPLAASPPKPAKPKPARKKSREAGPKPSKRRKATKKDTRQAVPEQPHVGEAAKGTNSE